MYRGCEGAGRSGLLLLKAAPQLSNERQRAVPLAWFPRVGLRERERLADSVPVRQTGGCVNDGRRSEGRGRKPSLASAGHLERGGAPEGMGGPTLEGMGGPALKGTGGPALWRAWVALR